MELNKLNQLNQTFLFLQNLAMKLSVIVTKGDIYHPFMINFPYGHLLEKVREYVDAFLAQNPSGFLLQVDS